MGRCKAESPLRCGGWLFGLMLGLALALVLLSVLLLSPIRQAYADDEPAPQPAGVMGDANGDRVVDAADVMLLELYLCGQGSLDEAALERLDMDGNANVAAKDMILLQEKMLAESLVSLPPSAPFAEGKPLVSVSDASAVPGDTVTVSVSISNNPGFGVVDIQLDYDNSKLELVRVDASDALSSLGSFKSNTKTGRVMFAGWPNVTLNEALFTATFKVLDSASTGDVTSEVSVGIAGLVDADLEDYAKEVAVHAGKVTALHQHSYGETTWEKDAASHWHACACGEAKSGEAAHDFADWVIDESATEDKAGLKHRTCTTCGWKDEASIPALGSDGTGDDDAGDGESGDEASAPAGGASEADGSKVEGSAKAGVAKAGGIAKTGDGAAFVAAACVVTALIASVGVAVARRKRHMA